MATFDFTHTLPLSSISTKSPLRIRINRYGVLPPGDWHLHLLLCPFHASIPASHRPKDPSDLLWVALTWSNVTMKTSLEYVGLEVSTPKGEERRNHTFFVEKPEEGFPRTKEGRLGKAFALGWIYDEIEDEDNDGKVKIRVHAKAVAKV